MKVRIGNRKHVRMNTGNLKVNLCNIIKIKVLGITGSDPIETGCFRILENGDFRILEDGDSRILETCDEGDTVFDETFDLTFE